MHLDSTGESALKRTWTKYGAALLRAIVAVVVVRIASRPTPVVVAVMLSEAASGPEVKRAAQMYFDDLNADGGVDGVPIQLEFHEGVDNADDAITAATSVVESDAWLVLGPNLSTAAIAAAAQLDGVIVGITPTATATEVTQGHDWYFRTAPSTKGQGNVLASYLLEIIGVRSVAVVLHPDDTYSRSFANEFVRPFVALGGSATEYELPHNTAEKTRSEAQAERDRIIAELIEDMSPPHTELPEDRSTPPDAIVLSLLGEEAADFVVDLRRRGITIPIVGGAALVGSSFVERFRTYSEEIANPGVFSDGVLTTTPFLFDTADEAGRRFKQKFEQVYPGREPTWHAAATHDAAQVAEQAIRSALRSSRDHRGRPRQGLRVFFPTRRSATGL